MLKRRWVSARARKRGRVVGDGAGGAPGFEPWGHLRAAGGDGMGFVVGDVVGAAHEGVDGAHGVGFVAGKDAEGPVEVFGLAAGDGAARGVGFGDVRGRCFHLLVTSGCSRSLRY